MFARKPYPSDVSDDEWAFVVPYLTLMTQDAPQREYPRREVFNGLRWMVRTGAPWRMIANDLPPWHTVYEQTQRSMSRPSAGLEQAALRPSSTTCARCCAWRAGARPSPQRQFSTGALCVPRRKAADAQALTATRRPKALKSMWLWTRWGIYWPCW